LAELAELPGVAIKCAEVGHATLVVNYSEDEYQAFLSQLDFRYDDGYGGQQLFGTVWLDNDGWLERYEYDGAEYWVFKKLPEIPLKLTRPIPIEIT
jgi:hypothetical protein